MDTPAPATRTLASSIAEILKANGVQRIFGIPGGGSSLAIMEAAGRAGLEFVLTRTETAGAIMAAVTGELTGTPGVMLTGIGPGATSAVNGIAYASLEKSPVILLTDGPASTPHQALDQNTLYAPITKMQGRLQPGDGFETIERAIEAAMTPPWGPVQLDLTAEDAASRLNINAVKPLYTNDKPADNSEIEAARSLISNSQKPVILAGVEARHGKAPEALRALAEALSCPVLVTLKAGGVLPTSHESYAGLFTGAIAEADLIHEADLIILYGFDAIELIPSKWSYDCPVVDLCRAESTPLPVKPAASAVGDIAQSAESLVPHVQTSNWPADKIDAARKKITERFALRGNDTAQTVTEAAAEACPEGTRLTVDAGAHMFSALAFWPAEEPYGVLKSDGLSTMGYALPAAIASSLQEPERPVLAITGDGGLMMCLSELTTAVERGCNITVVVINDAALSLIDIKQQRQQYKPRGVRYPSVDFAACAQAMGCAASRVEPGGDISAALKKAFAVNGPALVDVVCNSDGYGEQLVNIRG